MQQGPGRPWWLPAEPDFDVVRRNRKGPHAVPRAAGEYHIRDSSMNTRPAHEGGVPLTYIAVDYTRSGRPVRDSPPPRVGVFDAHDRAAQRSSLLVWNPHTKDWRMDGIHEAYPTLRSFIHSHSSTFSRPVAEGSVPAGWHDSATPDGLFCAGGVAPAPTAPPPRESAAFFEACGAAPLGMTPAVPRTVEDPSADNEPKGASAPPPPPHAEPQGSAGASMYSTVSGVEADPPGPSPAPPPPPPEAGHQLRATRSELSRGSRRGRSSLLTARVAELARRESELEEEGGDLDPPPSVPTSCIV